MTPRATNKVRTAMERLAEHLGIELVSSGGGRYEIILPNGHLRGMLYRKHRTFSRLVLYALEIGMSPKEIREAVNWKTPSPTELPEKVYRGLCSELCDKVGSSDARMLLRVFNEEAP